MNAQTKLSAKGQVVIPKDVRDRLGLTEGMVFNVIEREGEIVLKKDATTDRGMTAAQALREIQTFYRYDGPKLSVEDLDVAVRQAVADHFVAKSKQ